MDRHTMYDDQKDSQKGSILLIMFVFLTAIVLSFTICSGLYKSDLVQQALSEKADKLEQIKFFLQEAADCPATVTLNEGICDGGPAAIARKGSAVPLIKKAATPPYTVLLGVHLKAVCAASANKRKFSFLATFNETNSQWENLSSLFVMEC